MKMFTANSHLSKKFVLLFCVLAIGLAGTAFSKSVYFSANHNAQTFDAWNIGSTGLVSKQGTYSLQYAFNPAGVAIDGLTGVDPVTLQPLPPLLFVTTEGAGGIEMINAVTLEFHGVFSAPINMGGLDADDADNILYAIQRGTSGYGGNGTSNLFIYTYNDDGTGMAQVASITLPNHGYGMSLALDDSRDILWVADIQYNMVKAYDVDVSGVWSNIAEIPALSFSVSHVPVDVAVDSKRNIVYTSGSWYGSTLLSKYEVETGVETTTNCGSPLGVAVDEYSGYVYMTRLANDLAVWDCSTAPFTLLQDTPDLGSPAGIAIANGVGVNPLNLAKNFEVQGEGIWVGETFTYEITCDNVLNPNLEVTGVFIRDDMPVELGYVSETVGGVPGTGVYDPATHTVLWDIGTIPAGGTGPLVELVVHVNENALEGTTINNFANIWGDDVDTTTVDPLPDPECDPEIDICTPGEVVPQPFGDVFGKVTVDCPDVCNGLPGVEVKIYDGVGDLVGTVVTDAAGCYEMIDLVIGDYEAVVQVPLGYVPVSDGVVAFEITADPCEVNFELEMVASKDTYRCSFYYWKQQVQYLHDGTYPWRVETTVEEINGYLEAVFEHMYGRSDEFAIQIPYVTCIGSPPQAMTFADLYDVFFEAVYDGSYPAKARRSLLTVMLDFAAGFIPQAKVATADGATASQALTYLAELYLIGTEETAKVAYTNLKLMWRGKLIPSGVIPLSTPNVMYKLDEGEFVSDVLPAAFSLHQNYPNPFNPMTEIKFDLPAASDVRLEIFNVTGQMVAVLANGPMVAGLHTIEWDASEYASGMYMYRLTAGRFVDTKKMVLLK